jgi:hypothetical protein
LDDEVKGLLSRKDVLAVASVGLLIAILRVSFTQAEDMGIFLSISGLVARGYHLYSQAWETKDPLFFYTGAVSMRIIGLRGPFLIDVFWITSAAPIAYLLALRFKISRNIAAFSAIFFTLCLTGQHYQSFRTQIAAIILVLLAMLLALDGAWIPAGVVAVLVAGFKLPMVIELMAILPLFFGKGVSKRNVGRFLIGAISSTAMLGILMWSRAELFPW